MRQEWRTGASWFLVPRTSSRDRTGTFSSQCSLVQNPTRKIHRQNENFLLTLLQDSGVIPPTFVVPLCPTHQE